jgi:hypothetical protein
LIPLALSCRADNAELAKLQLLYFLCKKAEPYPLQRLRTTLSARGGTKSASLHLVLHMLTLPRILHLNTFRTVTTIRNRKKFGVYNTATHRGRLCTLCATLVLPGLLAWNVCGQTLTLDHFNPLSSKTAGVHLYGATISSSYFSNAYGLRATGLGVSGIVTPSDGYNSPVTMLQGSAVFGWSRPSETSSLSIVYSPSYVRGITESSFSSLNHSLAISTNRSISKKWGVAASMNAVVTDLSQLLFAPTRYGTLSATPATFDDLFATMLTGRSNNPGLTQVAGAAQLLSP